MAPAGCFSAWAWDPIPNPIRMCGWSLQAAPRHTGRRRATHNTARISGESSHDARCGYARQGIRAPTVGRAHRRDEGQPERHVSRGLSVASTANSSGDRGEQRGRPGDEANGAACGLCDAHTESIAHAFAGAAMRAAPARRWTRGFLERSPASLFFLAFAREMSSPLTGSRASYRGWLFRASDRREGPALETGPGPFGQPGVAFNHHESGQARERGHAAPAGGKGCPPSARSIGSGRRLDAKVSSCVCAFLFRARTRGFPVGAVTPSRPVGRPERATTTGTPLCGGVFVA